MAEFYANKPVRCSDFCFEVGDEIKYGGFCFIILSQYKNYKTNKYYTVRCMECGYINNVKEANMMLHRGCPVCANRKVIRGINDIGTTHPKMVEYFCDKSLAYSNTFGTLKKTDFICPHCSSIKKNRPIRYIMYYGFRCDKCMDGLTKPNKIMRNVLDQLNVEYLTEVSFEWSDKRRYDFYIPSMNLIIEMQGQHHASNVYISYKNYKENDVYKYNLAKLNDVDIYICIDSYKSEFDYIIKNILHSHLNEIFEIREKISIDLCENTYDDSYLIKACDLWNKYKPISAIEIGKYLNLSQSAVSKYLHTGTNLGICDYDARLTLTDKNNNTKISKIGAKNDR